MDSGFFFCNQIWMEIGFSLCLDLWDKLFLVYWIGKRDDLCIYIFTSADIDRQTVIEVRCPLRYCLIWDLKQEVEQNGSHLHFYKPSQIQQRCLSVVICLSAFLSGPEDWDLFVCPACLNVCLWVSYGSWQGDLFVWQMTQTWVWLWGLWDGRLP